MTSTNELIASKSSRRQFLVASGMVALQSLTAGWPAAAESNSGTVSKRFTFANGSGGILPCFTDYNLETHGLEFLAEIRQLPTEVEVPGRNRNAYYIQGDNRPDDLFMFLKAVLGSEHGIEPNQNYLLSFDLWFASQSNNCIGVGGSDAAVWLKAGGSTLEPVPLLQSDNFVSINVDKGDQEMGGRNLGFIGSIWNGEECPISKWVMLHKTYDHPFPIQASSGGELWIAVGTDSGFEGLTGVYYHSIGVRLSPVTA
jgi:hypothetical protein